MRLNSKQLEQSSIVWVLVADGEHAQIYRYHKTKKIIPMHDSKRHPYDEMIKSHDLTPVTDMEFQAQSLTDFEVSRDERGSLISQQYAGQNTVEPYEGICDDIAQNLVTKIAGKLNHYYKTRAFDNLVIAAPLKILGALKQQLNPPVLNCVSAEVDKDITIDKSHALLAHLQESFAEAHIG